MAGLDCQSGPDCAFGVVFVRDRRAEKCQDGIAHQPGDRAAVAGYGRVEKGK